MRKILFFVLVLFVAFAAAQQFPEKLDRGLVAVKNGNNAFLSWRLFAYDPDGVQFNVYRGSETTPLNAQPLDAAHTSFSVTNGGTAANTNTEYSVAVLTDGKETERTPKVKVWANGYLSIPVEKPTGKLYNGSTYATYTDYHIYDGAVADLDGDGEYEIVFFWAPDNLQDNANGGRTANVFIDAYKLNGTKLWGKGKWIDLGPNIRAGAHYLNFLVYDFDGDGKAEIIVKTADGTTDALGTRIGTTANHSNSDGYILSGTEYLSVFEGATGKLLASEPFEVARGTVNDWGDTYGNRVDRFLSAVAYLDGIRPHAVMCRGYYKGQSGKGPGRTGISSWTWDGTKLAKQWVFDTKTMANGNTYIGQGFHSLAVADVDGDGKDEIIFGSLTINNDGTVLYSTGYGHGDAMHVGKFDRDYPGLLFMGVHEEASATVPGMEMHDAKTGEIIWKVMAQPNAEGKYPDVGRGLIASIDSAYPRAVAWSASGLGFYAADGTKLTSVYPNNMSINMAIWWDGDTGRETFDGNIVKVNASAGTGGNLRNYSRTELNNLSGTKTIGGTKKNPVLQADIFGDWREEIVLPNTDNTELRIYSTATPTVHSGAGKVPASGIPTLMHDRTYRLATVWQNSGYNQPPHTGFYLGYYMDDVPRQPLPSSSSAPSSSSSSSAEITAALPNMAHINMLRTMQNAINLQVTNNASIEIFDLKGNAVRKLNFHRGNHFIQLGDLPQGLYIVKAKSVSWQKTVKMLVKK